jgi:hypothetical protein
MPTPKTLRLTVTKPIKEVLNIMKHEYPTLSDTELLKVALSEVAQKIEAKSLLLQASNTFGYTTATPDTVLYNPKKVKIYKKKS